MSEAFITMYTIYDHPSDYPNVFVARRWVIPRDNTPAYPELDVLTADTLDELRQKMPPDFTCIRRDANDDPKIVEVWL